MSGAIKINSEKIKQKKKISRSRAQIQSRVHLGATWG
jgi:hypothetical protein